MESINRSNACKGHVHHVACLEAVVSKAFSVPLRQHVNDVGRRWFGAVKSGFGPEVHSPNGSRVKPVSVDELHDGHGAHGCRVFVNVRDGHGLQTEAFAELPVVRSTKVGKVLHVHVQTWKMNGDVVNSNRGVARFGHCCPSEDGYMKGRFRAKDPFLFHPHRVNREQSGLVSPTTHRQCATPTTPLPSHLPELAE